MSDIQSLRPIAQATATGMKLPVMLKRFTTMTLMEIIQP